MEEDIADEEKDCSHGEGNELSHLGLFESVIWLAEEKLCLVVKNRTGSTQVVLRRERCGGFFWGGAEVAGDGA